MTDRLQHPVISDAAAFLYIKFYLKEIIVDWLHIKEKQQLKDGGKEEQYSMNFRQR